MWLSSIPYSLLYKLSSPQLSAERQVEELLLQQGQLLADLASLRSALHKRDETIGSLKANHVEHLAELNAELDSLRHDLVSAYQQKKNEVWSITWLCH